LLPDTDSVGNGAHSIGKVEPKPVRNVVIAAALGLLLGVVAGLIREQFDDTIRGTEEAEEAFGQPATVTLPSRFLGHRPFAGPRRKGADPVVAELAIQRLAAEILWSPESRDTRTLLVTSAHPEEGKTTVTANLAVEMASSGYRVIVVEADLRRPMLHGYLDVDPSAGEVGVDAVLRGRATVTSTMVEVPVWNRSAPRSRASGQSTEGAGRLRAILSAPGHTWPSEVGAERIGEFLNVLKSRADYVIFDAPPILVVPDAYSLVNAVDTVVVVVRNDRSTMKATEAMRRLLERLRPRRVELVVAETDEEYERSYRAYATPRASRPPRSAKLPAQQEEAMPRPVQPESPPPEATEPPPSEDTKVEPGADSEVSEAESSSLEATQRSSQGQLQTGQPPIPGRDRAGNGQSHPQAEIETSNGQERREAEQRLRPSDIWGPGES